MSTTRTRLALASALTTAALLTFGTSAHAQQGGIAERVGERLDNTGRAIKGGVQGASARVKARVSTMEVLDRVTSRLHWEKALATAVVEVEAQPAGVIVLRGAVPDARAKLKAVELTRDTVGVNQVVDQISVAPAGPTAPAPVIEAVPARTGR